MAKVVCNAEYAAIKLQTRIATKRTMRTVFHKQPITTVIIFKAYCSATGIQITWDVFITTAGYSPNNYVQKQYAKRINFNITPIYSSVILEANGFWHVKHRSEHCSTRRTMNRQDGGAKEHLTSVK